MKNRIRTLIIAQSTVVGYLSSYHVIISIIIKHGNKSSNINKVYDFLRIQCICNHCRWTGVIGHPFNWPISIFYQPGTDWATSVLLISSGLFFSASTIIGIFIPTRVLRATRAIRSMFLYLMGRLYKRFFPISYSKNYLALKVNFGEHSIQKQQI